MAEPFSKLASMDLLAGTRLDIAFLGGKHFEPLNATGKIRA